jgi:hypothetical protein
MECMFDIFARGPDGTPLWMESVEGAEKANKRVHELTLIAPPDYFIYSEASEAVESVEAAFALRVSPST